MNTNEIITYLGACNSRNLYPKRIDEINKSVPYFHLYKNDKDKYDIECFNYALHDNAPRMDLFKTYMKHAILPNVSNGDISGFYNIELHDSYTYLQNNINYKGMLTFSKFKDENGPVLIPDPYMTMNWGDQLKYIHDPHEWSDKNNKICFYGTTTGNRNAKLNKRINLCIDHIDSDICDFKITKIAQMSSDDIIASIGHTRFAKIYSDVLITPLEQMKYKFHLVVDGNTCRFDVWNYLTNSLSFKMSSNEMLWYYPLLRDKIHYVDVGNETMKQCYSFYMNNPRDSLRIIDNAKGFARSFFTQSTHMQYMTALFQSIEK